MKYPPFPAIKIGLLAVDLRARDEGSHLVEWAIEYVATELVPVVGVLKHRFLTSRFCSYSLPILVG